MGRLLKPERLLSVAPKMSSLLPSPQIIDKLPPVPSIRTSRFGTSTVSASSPLTKTNIPTGFPASDTSTMSRSQSSSLLPGIRPSRSGITPSWPSSTLSLDTKLKSTPLILHQTPTSSLPVVETVKSTSGTWLKEDISKRLMPNPQLTLSCSPPNFTGSSLVPNKVSRSTISQTRNSSTDTLPPPLTETLETPL